MSKKSAEPKLIMPNIPPHLPLAHIKTFHDEDSVNLSLIQDYTLENHIAENIAVNQVIFKNVTFNHVHWPSANLNNIIFEKCDLSNVDFSQCCIDRVHFTNCKLVGLNMAEASLRNVVFDNCNAAYAVMRYLDCKKVNFLNTSFTEADLYSAKLTDVIFSRCNLDKVQFSGTKLAGIDLSTCLFYQLALTPDDLRNCIIAPEQAIALANIFGVVIKE